MRQPTTATILGVAVLLVAAACGDSGTDTATTLSAAVATTSAPTTLPPTLSAPTTLAPTTSTPTTVTVTTLPPSSTTTVVDPISTSDFVTIGGLGAVRVGMTMEEAEAAAGLELAGEPDVRINEGCYFISPVGLDGVTFMVTDGTIARVDIVSGPITTRSGAGIGSTEQEIKNLFGDQIVVSPHAYVEGHYLTFVPVDEGDDRYRVVFETDGREVTQYRAGRLPEVDYVEGCV